MILYDVDRWLGWGVLFHFTGSALPHTFPMGCVAGLCAYLYSLITPLIEHQVILHPNAYFSGFSFILGFLVVIRANISYQRYWEGRTQIAILMSKLTDVACHAVSWVQTTDEAARHFKAEIGQLLVLFHGLAMQRLRGISDLTMLEHLRVITPAQLVALEDKANPEVLVMSWLTNAWVRRGQVGLAVQPPVFSRTFQILSDAHVAFNSARKVRETPFPFPLAQLATALLTIFMLSSPAVIVAFVENLPLAISLSCLVVWAFFAVNRASVEMENPFGMDHNDLPMMHYFAEFHRDMEALGLLEIVPQPSPGGTDEQRDFGALLSPEVTPEAVNISMLRVKKSFSLVR